MQKHVRHSSTYMIECERQREPPCNVAAAGRARSLRDNHWYFRAFHVNMGHGELLVVMLFKDSARTVVELITGRKNTFNVSVDVFQLSRRRFEQQRKERSVRVGSHTRVWR